MKDLLACLFVAGCSAVPLLCWLQRYPSPPDMRCFLRSQTKPRRNYTSLAITYLPANTNTPLYGTKEPQNAPTQRWICVKLERPTAGKNTQKQQQGLRLGLRLGGGAGLSGTTPNKDYGRRISGRVGRKTSLNLPARSQTVTDPTCLVEAELGARLVQPRPVGVSGVPHRAAAQRERRRRPHHERSP